MCLDWYNFYVKNFVFTVRLVDGSSYNEGRVEVYYSGRWGTVCSNRWDDHYASLVCTQLGFGSSGELADFGPGTGSVFLEIVMCPKNDTILASCTHYGVGITVRCDHSKDIGVKCNGMHIAIASIFRKLYSNNLFLYICLRFKNSGAKNYAD